MQADLTAAANIGLRALLDPDFPGKWWYIPCDEDKIAGTAIPRVDKVKGSVCFGADASKPETFGSLVVTKPSDANQTDAKKRGRSKGDGKGKETTNFWCDISSQPLLNAEMKGFWLSTPAYWRWVRKRAVVALRIFNKLDEQIDLAGLDPDPIEK